MRRTEKRDRRGRETERLEGPEGREATGIRRMRGAERRYESEGNKEDRRTRGYREA
jgi:hypothetical protein